MGAASLKMVTAMIAYRHMTMAMMRNAFKTGPMELDRALMIARSDLSLPNKRMMRKILRRRRREKRRRWWWGGGGDGGGGSGGGGGGGGRGGGRGV